jgi:hypothetical protein
MIDINGIKDGNRSYASRESRSTVLRRKAASPFAEGQRYVPSQASVTLLHRVYNLTSCSDRGRCRVHRSTAQHEGRKVRAGALRALASGLETNNYVAF